MSPWSARHIELEEYTPVFLPQQALTREEALYLYREHGARVDIDEPGFKTEACWRLVSKGHVGHIPVHENLALVLRPKVQVRNLFRMLEMAYRLPFDLPGLTQTESLLEVFESLASILAKRTLDRARRGLHRTYVPRAEVLGYLRGTLDMRERLRRPWHPALPCRFEDHTADVADNQILAWTLRRVARCGLLSGPVLPQVRRAYRAVHGLASLHPFVPQDCVGRLYHRLNDDYRPLHALCRFFLENTGPTHERGSHTMLPFLLNMNHLFQEFVAAWLREHLPHGYQLATQHRVDVGTYFDLSLRIDLVLRDAIGRPLAVLDTKYKAGEKPEIADLNQVVAYAKASGCRKAWLIYPKPLAKPLDARYDDIRVQYAVFALEGDLDLAGQKCLATVLGTVAASREFSS